MDLGTVIKQCTPYSAANAFKLFWLMGDSEGVPTTKETGRVLFDPGARGSAPSEVVAVAEDGTDDDDVAAFRVMSRSCSSIASMEGKLCR